MYYSHKCCFVRYLNHYEVVQDVQSLGRHDKIQETMSNSAKIEGKDGQKTGEVRFSGRILHDRVHTVLWYLIGNLSKR